MVLSVKTAASAAYYFQGCEHVTSKTLANGVWLRGHSTLGVTAGTPIKQQALDRLLHRTTAVTAESPLFSLKSGSSGYDFVFSVPKSVSILWAVSDKSSRELIETAHHAAVSAAVRVLADEAIFERRGKGGRTLHTASPAIGAFLHVKCRPAEHDVSAANQPYASLFPDPNLHTHIVVPDIVVSSRTSNVDEGSLKIAYTALYGRWYMALGAWYHATLADELRRRGLDLKPSGQNGVFALEDFNAKWTFGFSARTEGSKDLFPDQDRATALQKSRAKPIIIELEALEKLWALHADSLSINIAQTVSAPSKCNVNLLSVKDIEGVVASLDENEAVLQRQNIFRAIAIYLVEKELCLSPSVAMVAQILNSGLLEPLPDTESYSLPQWTSVRNRENEVEVEHLVAKLDNGFFGSVSLQPHLATTPIKLLPAQIAAANQMAGPSKLGVLLGGPGTGKTTLLEPVIRAYQLENGAKSVIGVAEAWLQALQLKSRFQIEAFSLETLLNMSRSGALELQDGKKLIIIDEAGLLSTKRMRDVLTLAHKFRIKIILLGDPQQLDPIAAGSGLRLACLSNNVATLSEIKRQAAGPTHDIASRLTTIADARKTAEAGIAIADKRREARAQFEELAEQMVSNNQWCAYGTTDEAIKAIVTELVEHSKLVGDKAPPLRALMRSHREAQHLTRRMRDALRKEGLISGPEIRLKAITPMGQVYHLLLAKGDHVRFLARDSEIGVFNGTEGYVTDIKPGDDPEITVELAPNTVESVKPATNKAPAGSTQKVISFHASELQGQKDKCIRLACGYAMTIYGSQGATFDRVLILKSRMMNFRDLYVAITRAKDGFKILEASPRHLALQNEAAKQQKLVSSIAHELKAIERRDHGKALARDHLVIPNTPRPEPIDWEWHIMVEGEISHHV